MRTEPAYLVYPWWPENGDDWVHPSDVRLARSLIPGTRVFRRLGREGAYVVLGYGVQRLRVKPTMRQAIAGDGYDIGNRVEVCSRLGKNRPFVATVREMDWNAHFGVIQYRLERRAMILARRYTAADLRPVGHVREATFVRSESTSR
jgi:hypothetical protein